MVKHVPEDSAPLEIIFPYIACWHTQNMFLESDRLFRIDSGKSEEWKQWHRRNTGFIGAYSLRPKYSWATNFWKAIIGLGPTDLGLTHSLPVILHLKEYLLTGSYRPGANRFLPHVLDLRMYSLDWGLQTWGRQIPDHQFCIREKHLLA